jgi:hypothetical protein
VEKNKYVEKQVDELDLGLKEKIALWLLVRYLKGKGIMNIKNYGVGDWLKLIANAAGGAAVGFSQGGYVGAVVTALVAVASLLQTPPAHTTDPK